jgi:ABC-type histidine transport system ATPase subunit
MAKNIIEVEDLVKKFHDFEAVKGVSFSVKKGEIFERDTCCASFKNSVTFRTMFGRSDN